MRVLGTVVVMMGLIGLPSGCRRPAPRPSVVLIVLDTVRADGVSAYGSVQGTTPNLDALARTGLLYEHAYANANWTLPSHASLFTGLLPSQHGVSAPQDMLAPVPTLAEQMQLVGYETVGVTENPWLLLENGLKRGFQRFDVAEPNVVEMIERWLRDRRSSRPYFLFLNLMDAHAPYKVRDSNPFLPADVTAAQARAVSQSLADHVCATKDPGLTVLRGLYLGNIRAADAELGGVVAALKRLTVGPMLLVVAADHGEYLGENWQVGHVIGVGESVLHVPLVVVGLPGVAPARITSPVQLVDVMPSILDWIDAPLPSGMFGEMLPTRPGTPARRGALISEYDDRTLFGDRPMPEFMRRFRTNLEERCGPTQRVFGSMRAIIRYPHKLVWSSRYEPQLFALDVDPTEQRDLQTTLPGASAALSTELEATLRAAKPRAETAVAAPDSAVQERLRALGYLDGDHH